MNANRDNLLVAGLTLVAAALFAGAALTESALTFVSAGLAVTLIAFVIAVRGSKRRSATPRD